MIKIRLTKKEYPSFKSKVLSKGAMKQAGKIWLYEYSTNPGRTS